MSLELEIEKLTIAIKELRDITKQLLADKEPVQKQEIPPIDAKVIKDRALSFMTKSDENRDAVKNKLEELGGIKIADMDEEQLRTLSEELSTMGA